MIKNAYNQDLMLHYFTFPFVNQTFVEDNVGRAISRNAALY